MVEKTWLLLVPVVIPLLGLILMIRWRKRHIWMKKILPLSTSLIVFVVNSYLVIGVINGKIYDIPQLKINNFLQIYIKFDQLGAIFSFLVSLLWVFVTIYSFGYMKGHGRQFRYFTFFIVSLGVTMGIAYSGNLFTLYIFYELLTLATYPLVVHKEDKKAIDAGKKYLVYSFSGAALILMGMIVFYAAVGTLDFIPGGISALDSRQVVLICFMLFFFGFGVKAAVVPLHSWLPQAMVAPTPVSALLHAVAVVKAGVFSLARVVYYLIGTEIVKDINVYFLYIIAFSILFGSVLALGQSNLKRRLAYSTISQLGYVLLGLMLANPRGYIGGMLHIINHALIKIVLFLCAGCIMTKTGKTEIKQLRGIGREMPVTMTAFTLASICLVGLPPTNGFVSKWYLSLGSLDGGHTFLVVVLLLSALLTAGYLFPIVGIAFFTREERQLEGMSESSPSMLLPVVFISILMVLSGFYADNLVDFIASIAETLF